MLFDLDIGQSTALSVLAVQRIPPQQIGERNSSAERVSYETQIPTDPSQSTDNEDPRTGFSQRKQGRIRAIFQLILHMLFQFVAQALLHRAKGGRVGRTNREGIGKSSKGPKGSDPVRGLPTGLRTKPLNQYRLIIHINGDIRSIRTVLKALSPFDPPRRTSIEQDQYGPFSQMPDLLLLELAIRIGHDWIGQHDRTASAFDPTLDLLARDLVIGGLIYFGKSLSAQKEFSPSTATDPQPSAIPCHQTTTIARQDGARISRA